MWPILRFKYINSRLRVKIRSYYAVFMPGTQWEKIPSCILGMTVAFYTTYFKDFSFYFLIFVFGGGDVSRNSKSRGISVCKNDSIITH